jgi:superfamily II DNA helicase RecQ
MVCRAKSVSRQTGGVSVGIGTRVGLSGGFGGVVERELPIGVLVALEPGPGRVSVKWGEQITTSEGSGPLRPGAVGADAVLLDTLKRWRLDTARAQNVPAFVVLTDASLEELARRRPQTEGELLDVRGIGPAKLESYGDDLLELLAGD